LRRLLRFGLEPWPTFADVRPVRPTPRTQLHSIVLLEYADPAELETTGVVTAGEVGGGCAHASSG